MTHDNDLIRRGAILELCQTLEDEAPSGSYDNGGTTDGWMMACRRVEKAIAALPAVAASQPANPVINADSRQRVMVKPLVWEEVNPGVFVAESSLGVWSRFDGHYMRPDASGGIASDNPEAAAQADYAARIMSAIDVHPDPRDEVIARLVEALGLMRSTYPYNPPCYGWVEQVEAHKTAKAALAAAKEVMK